MQKNVKTINYHHTDVTVSRLGQVWSNAVICRQ